MPGSSAAKSGAAPFAHGIDTCGFPTVLLCNILLGALREKSGKTPACTCVSGSYDEFGDEVATEHEPVAQVHHSAGKVTLEVVHDEPTVVVDGLRAEEGPRVLELAGRLGQPCADLVVTDVLAAVVDDPRAGSERSQRDFSV